MPIAGDWRKGQCQLHVHLHVHIVVAIQTYLIPDSHGVCRLLLNMKRTGHGGVNRQ